jgi:Raf kinase inhibitor-like YbhB/YbcL family protein
MRTALVAIIVFALPALAGGKFTVKSADLKPNATVAAKQVFSGMGCTGENVSPELTWSNPPKDTKSFVVTMYDPDAPTGSGWWHWVVYNIPADTMTLAAGAGSAKGTLPAGAVQGKTDFGAAGYGGPCPPPGDKPHRYIITVTALKVDKIDVPADATAAYVGFMTHMNKLGSATLTGKYAQPKAPAK